MIEKTARSFYKNRVKATSKNVTPAKAGIHKLLTLLDSRLRGSDKLEIIRGSLKIADRKLKNLQSEI